MTSVKMLTCLVGDGFVVLAGELHHCDEAEARRMIADGLAEPVPPAEQRETATDTSARRRSKRG